MARNLERDAKEMTRRKNQLLKAGFKLFSEKGIEAVSLQNVADEAEVGAATLYNYYQNKNNLVVAISANMWRDVYNDAVERLGSDTLKNMNAYEAIKFYTDSIIYLYREKPEILCFSANYKTYMCRESFSENLVGQQFEALEPIGMGFHDKFEKAKLDGSIRADISEEQLFSTVSITMLCMAERYAQGLVWCMKDDNDYLAELENVQDMILKWIRP